MKTVINQGKGSNSHTIYLRQSTFAVKGWWDQFLYINLFPVFIIGADKYLIHFVALENESPDYSKQEIVFSC